MLISHGQWPIPPIHQCNTSLLVADATIHRSLFFQLAVQSINTSFFNLNVVMTKIYKRIFELSKKFNCSSKEKGNESTDRWNGRNVDWKCYPQLPWLVLDTRLRHFWHRVLWCHFWHTGSCGVTSDTLELGMSFLTHRVLWCHFWHTWSWSRLVWDGNLFNIRLLQSISSLIFYIMYYINVQVLRKQRTS